MPKKEVEKKKTEAPRLWSTPIIVAWIGIGLLISIIIAGMIIGALDITPSAEQSSSAGQTQLALPDRIARHIAVPEGEEPTIATVEDPEAMRQNNPSFYKNASVGDVLVVWSSMAVLYSPEKDLILGVLPLSVVPADGVTPQEEPVLVMEEDPLKKEQETLKIEVLNGTRTPGLGREVSELLEKEGFTTLRPRDARVKGYEKTLIIKRIEGEFPESMKRLADLLGAEVAELPAAETLASGDIVIILGSSYVPK